MVQFNFTYQTSADGSSNVSTEQMKTFEMAGQIWGKYLKDDVTINIHIANNSQLPNNVVGGALPGIAKASEYGDHSEFANALNNDITSRDDIYSSYLSHGTMVDNLFLWRQSTTYLTTANGKALDISSVSPDALDGVILMSDLSNLAWNQDSNPGNDIGWRYYGASPATPYSLDFLSVALHEIGHILGFTSGVDDGDWFQRVSDTQEQIDEGILIIHTHEHNDQQLIYVTGNYGFGVEARKMPLDFFRYTKTSVSWSQNALSTGEESYFSLDRGSTKLADFSTSKYGDGDGYQASHWKNADTPLGIMAPALRLDQTNTISLLDLRAFDAIGWDLVDSLLGSDYDISQAELEQTFDLTNPQALNNLWQSASHYIDQNKNSLIDDRFNDVLQMIDSDFYEGKRRRRRKTSSWQELWQEVTDVFNTEARVSSFDPSVEPELDDHSHSSSVTSREPVLGSKNDDTLTGSASRDKLVSKPGESNNTLDAGLVEKPEKQASLGDRVWLDHNKNGIQDEGESGVSGVTVTLTSSGEDGVIGTADDTTATTTTDSNGNYSFEQLNPGEGYQLTFELPSNVFEFTTANQGSNDALDSDADPSTGITQIVTLAPGEQNSTLDAGIVEKEPEKSSLGDRVWLDANKDGIQDGGEQGVQGVSVTLTGGGEDGVIGNADDTTATTTATTTTDTDGPYQYPGEEYQVTFELPESDSNNLVKNGSFEQNTIAKGEWGFQSSLTGWSQTLGSGIEVQELYQNFGAADDGDAWLELDARHNTGISQTINTQAGQSYELSFAYAPRPGVSADSNTLKVYWNGELIDTLSESGVGQQTSQWKTYTYDVTGSDNATTGLEFRSAGRSDGLGAFLDDVKVVTSSTNVEFTQQNAGNNDGRDSDAAPSTGTTQIVTLAPGENNSTLDAGIVEKKPKIDLSITKTSARAKWEKWYGSTAYGGNIMEYNVTVTNNSTSEVAATGVVVKDIVPENINIGEFPNDIYVNGQYYSEQYGQYLYGLAPNGGAPIDPTNGTVTIVDPGITNTPPNGSTLPAGFTYGLPEGSVTWEIGQSIAPGESVTLTYFGERARAITNSSSVYLYDSRTDGTQFFTDASIIAVDQHDTNPKNNHDSALSHWISPISLDLNGDGIQTRSIDQGVKFDLLNTGEAINTGWLSGDDGFLAIDNDGDGLISSRAELFGGGVGDGFAKLSTFDSNGDGLVNPLDAQFGQLKLWQDANESGITDPGELISLEATGITDLNTSYTNLFATDAQGNIQGEVSSALKNGSTIEMTDVYFQVQG